MIGLYDPLQVGEVSPLLTIDPNFLGHPSTTYIHQKLNGTEVPTDPKSVSCETDLLDTQVFSGSVERGSCWRFLGHQ